MTLVSENIYTDRDGQVWVNKVEAMRMMEIPGRLKFERIVNDAEVPRYRRRGHHTIWFKIEDIEKLQQAEEEFYLIPSPKAARPEHTKIPA